STLLKVSAIALVTALGGTGCLFRPAVHMNVRAYSDPDVRLGKGTRFALESTGQTTGGVLLEKALLRNVRDLLVERGLVEDKKNPQVVISLTGFVGAREQYVPPSTFYMPQTTTTTTKVEETDTKSGEAK